MSGKDGSAARPSDRRHAGLAVILGGVLLAQPEGAAAQGVADSGDAFRTSLVAADQAAADLAMKSGLGSALGTVGSPDLVLVYPGAPVLAGRETATQFLASPQHLTNRPLRWVPLYAEASSDGTFGVTYGVTAIISGVTADLSLRFGKYLSAWTRTASGWRLVAHAQLYLVAPSQVLLPLGFAAPHPPPIDRARPSAAFAVADSEFAARAGREGAAAAFAAYASVDAVTFPDNGLLTRGPSAIGHSVADEGPPSYWRWWPVAAGGSDSGDLGFTVGEAEIRSGDTAAGGTVYYGKYLTLWRRDRNGQMRFLADGGSPRPAPIGP